MRFTPTTPALLRPEVRFGSWRADTDHQASGTSGSCHQGGGKSV